MLLEKRLWLRLRVALRQTSGRDYYPLGLRLACVVVTDVGCEIEEVGSRDRIRGP